MWRTVLAVMGMAERRGQRLGMSVLVCACEVKVISDVPGHVESTWINGHVKTGFAIWKVNISPRMRLW